MLTASLTCSSRPSLARGARPPSMKGSRFRAILAGGGGYGDPFERDPELVRADVSEEKITIGYAKKNYGVVIKPGPGATLDKAVTKKLRAKRRPPKLQAAE